MFVDLDIVVELKPGFESHSQASSVLGSSLSPQSAMKGRFRMSWRYKMGSEKMAKVVGF